MKGTFPFCRTNEAIKRMGDGDVIQNQDDELYFKKEGDIIFVSHDNFHWEEYTKPMELYPPYAEWRSLSNLHYWEDLKKDSILKKGQLKYLTLDDRVLDEEDTETDRTKKRWFVGEIL